MLKALFILAATSLLAASALPATAQNDPSTESRHVYATFRSEDIDWVKKRASAGDPTVLPAMAQLRSEADRMLAIKARSVMSKKGIASSDDRHDFYAMGKYSWRDADAPESAYVRRDGARNPEAMDDKYDKKNFNETVRFINALSLAYSLTGERRYAQKSAELIRTWFLDPATRMNPNFRHAAIQPGVNDGGYGGIIEGVVLIEMLDYVALLEGSGALSKSDEDQLKKWFGSLSEWLVTSDFGRSEARMKNNHGTWYRAQVAAFSLYSGNPERARSVMATSPDLLTQQFAKDGSLPLELKRADGELYSVYGLRAWITLARLSEGLGDSHSLWRIEREGQPILEKGLLNLGARYQKPASSTSGDRRAKIDPYAVQVLRLGAEQYRSSDISAALVSIADQLPPTDRRARLLGPVTPPSKN